MITGVAAGSVEGFEIAFYSSLSEPITIASVPRMIAVLNGTLTAVLALDGVVKHHQHAAGDHAQDQDREGLQPDPDALTHAPNLALARLALEVRGGSGSLAVARAA